MFLLYFLSLNLIFCILVIIFTIVGFTYFVLQFQPRKSSYDHQQTINAPLLYAIELCIDSLRASQRVKPLYNIHSGDSESKTLLKKCSHVPSVLIH